MRLFILILLFVVSPAANAQFPTHTRPGEKDTILVQLANAKEDTTRVNMYISLFYDYPATKKEKRKYAVAIARLSQELSYKKGIAEGYNCLGLTDAHSLAHVGRTMGDYNMARYYFEQTGNMRGVGAVLSNIGKSLFNRGDRTGALDTFLRARVILEQCNDTAYLPFALYNIGSCYFKSKDYPRAIAHYNKAKSIFEFYGVQQGVAGCYWAIGHCYRQQKQYHEAIDAAKLSLEASQKSGCEKCISVSKKLLKKLEKKYVTPA